MRYAFILSLFLTSLFAADYSFIVKEEILQERMRQEFPITKKTMFLTFHVKDPKLSLDGKRQRFNFTATLQLPDVRDSKGRAASAIVSFSSRIAYSKGGNLYLRKIKVTDIKSELIGESMKGMLYGTLESALNEYYKSRAIYSLKNEKGIVGQAVKAIKNVVIVDEGIKIIFGQL